MYEPDIKIFQAEDGSTEIQVVVQSETVWLSQKQMADLFEKDSDTIGLHLRNIFKSGELIEKATTEKSSVVQKEGKRNVTRTLKLYNLDAIISTGYRVNSKRGIQFRIWANQVLKDYLIKGFALNERRLNSENKQYHYPASHHEFKNTRHCEAAPTAHTANRYASCKSRQIIFQFNK